MRALCATLIFLFGLYVMWGATGYFFDEKSIGTLRGTFWLIATLVLGATIALASKRLARWLTAEFDDAPVNDSRIAPTLVRLFGCYVVWTAAPGMAQWVVWFFTDGASQSYQMSKNAARLLGFLQVGMQVSIVVVGVLLALVPERSLRWASRFDRTQERP